METTVAATQSTIQSEQKSTKPDFGSGRYSSLMEECWHDSQTVFKLTSEQAEKLARQIASDFGAAIRNAPVTVGVRATGKDNKLTLGEACKVKGVTGTNALHCLRALHYAAEAGKFGFSYANTGWKTVGTIAEYLANL